MDASIPSQSAINKSVSKSHECVYKMPSAKQIKNPMDKTFPMINGARDMDDMMSSIPMGIK
jgi:hypothetical protein